MDTFAAISRFCNYQERCHKEARHKLYELGCNAAEVEQHITALIEAGLLNEQRYATAIVRGKFRLKGWGRNKIIQHLKASQISIFCIKEALKGIEEEEYHKSLVRIAEKKIDELRGEKKPAMRRLKVYRYLLQKGYEGNLINEVLSELLPNR